MGGVLPKINYDHRIPIVKFFIKLYNGELKPSAPAHCAKRIGDLDKLCRAVFDSLDTANVVNDDSQFVSLYAHRRFTIQHEQPCAIISVTALS